MSIRSAVIWSVLLVGGVLFIFPTAIEVIYLPSLRQGNPNPIPDYEAMLLSIALFCHRYRWLFAPLTAMLLFLTAAVTREGAATR